MKLTQKLVVTNKNAIEIFQKAGYDESFLNKISKIIRETSSYLSKRDGSIAFYDIHKRIILCARLLWKKMLGGQISRAEKSELNYLEYQIKNIRLTF